MFLTKNPARYVDLFRRDLLPMWDNMWYGTTTPTPEDEFFYAGFVNTFVSVEPILAPFVDLIDDCDGVYPATRCNWIIIGAETGNRKNKVVPEKHWIMELVECAQKCNVPVFIKESLRDLMGADFRQETPWEVIL